MRRLKHAFARNRQQFVLTSATIGGDREKIRDFAERLTGADFKPDSILTGTVVSQFDAGTHPHALKEYTAFLKDESDLAKWFSSLDDSTSLLHLIRRSRLEPVPEEHTTEPSTILGEWFARNRELDIAYAAERPGLSGNKVRLPEPPRKLSATDASISL